MFCITTAHGDVYVWDIETRSLSDWSAKHSFRLPKQIQQQSLKGSFFPTSYQLIVYADEFFCIIDMRINSFKYDTRFQSIMSVLGCGGDEMVVAERPAMMMAAELPEAFTRKKYAT